MEYRKNRLNTEESQCIIKGNELRTGKELMKRTNEICSTVEAPSTLH